MSEDSDAVIFAAGADAFGDGSHPTTRGMLAALEEIDPALFTPRHACDIGAGSGILSLAVAQLFGCPVVAVDLSEEAVEKMKENFAVNGLADRLHAVRADGFAAGIIDASAPYDLILMNILAEPLIRLASEADRHLAHEGVLVLSGILKWQEGAIRETYASLGLELASRLVLGDWVTLVWQKP